MIAERLEGFRYAGRTGVLMLAFLAAVAAAVAFSEPVRAGSASAAPSAQGPGRFLARPVTLRRLGPGESCPTSPILRTSWDPYPFVGVGPVYLQTGDGRLFLTGSSSGTGLGASLPWEVRSAYRGPLLVRVRRLDGSFLSIRLWQADANHPGYLWWPSVSYLKPNLSHGFWGCSASGRLAQSSTR